MNLSKWAEKEVERYKKTYNKDIYTQMCADSALKAFKSLLDDGHSGSSFSFTRNILDRLMNNFPLMPIEDSDFVRSPDMPKEDDKYLKEYNLKDDIQCPRMSSLFKKIYLDGTVKYTDVERAIWVDTENNTTWINGWVRDFIDHKFPITMPYYPIGFYKVYGHEISETNNFIECIETPEHEKIEINKEFDFSKEVFE